MHRNVLLVITVALIAGLVAARWTANSAGRPPTSTSTANLERSPMNNPYFGADGPLPESDAEWQKVLTPEQFRIARQHGTERAFTGTYNDDKEPGVYRCICCGQPLFTSAEKFDSGSGWPSFWKPTDQNAVGMSDDSDFFLRRVEVHCSRCRAHLGHIFDDGPKPTGLRYCINSACLARDPNMPAQQPDAK